jgi:hypothetical protein
MDFKSLKKSMQEAFLVLTTSSQNILFVTDVNRDLLWETYLDSFPNLEERQGHNCNCCRQFIKNYGNVVAIINNQIVTIWNFKHTDFQVTVDSLNQLVLASNIKDVFLSDTTKLGTDTTKQVIGLESDRKTGIPDTIIWNHFFIPLDKKMVYKGSDSMDSYKGSFRDSRNVFKRALDEISLDTIETTLELINQGSVYRGEEFKEMIYSFRQIKKDYDIINNKELYCWIATSNVPAHILKIRNSAIGTLLQDIQEGKELDHCCNAFESKMRGYKVPLKTVTSKKQIQEAEKFIQEQGLIDSLERRFAVVDDITVNNLLYVNRATKKTLGVFDELKQDLPVNPKTLSKVEEITIDKFISDILPNTKNLEVLFENKHLNNLSSIITAKNSEAPTLMKWNNPFCWYYTNAVTDSMRDRVVSSGGRVDGVFRFTHSWNELEKNQSLMDLHVFMPNSNIKANKEPLFNDVYGSGDRVGWNNRSDYKSGGVQDVDHVNPAPEGFVPIENITFPNIKTMPEGQYICKIHNWNHRSSGGKGKAEIEFDGNIYQYEYPATKHKEWITVAIITLKNGNFSIEHYLPESNSSKSKWNLSTNKFQKVSMIMNSPNYWDDNQTGNKHCFFIIDNCINDEPTRGFFNEFLKEDLMKQKRVFEILGSKFKVEPSNNQLSGLGFSSTQRNSLIVKVEGKFERLLKINF